MTALGQAAGDPGPLERVLESPAASSLPGRVVAALAVLALAALVIGALARATSRVEERAGGPSGRISTVAGAVRLLLWVLALYVAVAVGLRPEEQEAWILGAGLVLLLVLGARGLAADWMGGLLLLSERPFGVGDRVVADGHEGEVLAVGPSSVRLLDADAREVRIPNRRLIGSVIANASRGEPGSRVSVAVHLPVDVDLGRARRLAREAAISSRYVDLADEVEVHAASRLEGERAVELHVEARTLDRRDANAFRTEVLESLLEALGRRRDGG
jgi:small-conductance mechanosensitive channel